MPITHCSTFSQELPLFLLHCLRDLGLKPKGLEAQTSLPKEAFKEPLFRVLREPTPNGGLVHLEKTDQAYPTEGSGL